MEYTPCRFIKVYLQGINLDRHYTTSFEIAALSAAVATLIAFVLAYTCYYTNLPAKGKSIIRIAAMFPMFMPTITYGFAIIYSFGNNGLLTKCFHHKLPFDLYGIWGLLIGYSVYTIPVAFLLISNTMQYIDKKAMVVSKVMGDKSYATFGSLLSDRF